MNKAFSKLAVIALMTLLVLMIYSYFIPKYDYSKIIAQSTDSLFVVEIDSISSDSINSAPVLDKVEPTKKKKKYVKKIKPVSFSEIIGGDDFSKLDSFFGKLKTLENHQNTKLRIAYFGDSITESDLGTNRLRTIWQDSLGGKGVGFVPAVSKLSQYRASIKHTYSDNWKEYSISRMKDRVYPLGLYGNVAVPSIPVMDSLAYDSTSVSWHSYSMMEGNWLTKPTLQVLNPKAPLSIKFIANRDTLTTTINVSDQLQFITLSDSLLKYLSVSYYPQDTCYVYGLDFSDENGIYIDNYSLRGNKGNNFINLNNEVVKQSLDHFNYDLTILHYGANVTDPIMKDYSWYRISMKKNIRYLQDFLGEKAIILFSVGDRGAQKDSLWVSSPDLPYLIKEQKRIAKDTKIGFFNLFTALGGENSNVELEKDHLLTPDHTHFTRKGARHFGHLIFNKFMEEYHGYLEKINAD